MQTLLKFTSFSKIRWREGPSLCPPSKCSQRHLLLPAGHPRHHASLHSPLPSHVPAYVCSKKESPGHLPQAGLVFMFCIASYTAFASSLDESSGNILYLFGESFADFNLSACHECQLSMWLMKYSIVAQNSRRALSERYQLLFAWLLSFIMPKIPCKMLNDSHSVRPTHPFKINI